MLPNPPLYVTLTCQSSRQPLNLLISMIHQIDESATGGYSLIRTFLPGVHGDVSVKTTGVKESREEIDSRISKVLLEYTKMMQEIATTTAMSIHEKRNREPWQDGYDEDDEEGDGFNGGTTRPIRPRY